MAPENTDKREVLAYLREKGRATVDEIAGALQLDAEKVRKALRELPEVEFLHVIKTAEHWRMRRAVPDYPGKTSGPSVYAGS